MPAQVVQVARADEIPEGKVKVVEVEGRRIALCNYGGNIYAIDDVCTHDRGPLGQGELIGNEIECPRHGARFDVTTGRVVRLPAVRPVRTYPVHVTDGVVSIEVS
ncbi:MAG TPA: non-heme iron oxygenase ferredoxin subunit [Candidatus Eremiobacteraceae bacterium]|nr:non-heme iron oxygenase ferredoxin subunit [Candidatus Eremiobacteraceae bacterium]